MILKDKKDGEIDFVLFNFDIEDKRLTSFFPEKNSRAFKEIDNDNSFICGAFFFSQEQDLDCFGHIDSLKP